MLPVLGDLNAKLSNNLPQKQDWKGIHRELGIENSNNLNKRADKEEVVSFCNEWFSKQLNGRFPKDVPAKATYLKG